MSYLDHKSLFLLGLVLKEVLVSDQLGKTTFQRKIETHLAENKEDLKYRRHLEEKYTWIELDKGIFGQKNSAYDFEQKNPQKAEKELQKAKSKKEKLNGQINQRAMALLQQAEKAQEASNFKVQ